MTWIVMCPQWQSQDHVNKPHGWSLSQEALDRIGDQYFDPAIECIVCRNKFSLQQGLGEAFCSDVPFVIHHFQYNARENGEAEIKVGELKTIKFSESFEDTAEIYLTPYKEPVAAVPGRITNAQFSVFSSDSGTTGETRKIGWAAYGNREYAKTPIWRKLISSSKQHQLRKDFRPEVVDLESAFEVFIGEYLGDKLKNKLRDETINWILKFSIEEQLKAGFMELTGKPLSKLESESYVRWQRGVKELRDSVVHRGVSVNGEKAREAREATFDLITRIDPSAIDHFKIHMEKIRSKHPNFTFGTATIKGRKER